MYYYIEYLERKPGVSQERFDEVVLAASEKWAKEHPEDELLLNIGRTWRLGPNRTYMTVWKIRDLATLARWNDEFQKQHIRDEHDEFAEVATIVEAGLYADMGHEIL